jgi:hypothetical protein
MSSFRERIKGNPWPVILALLLVILLIFKILSYFSSTKNELAIKAGNWDKLMLVMSQIDQNYVDSIVQ